MLLTYGSQVTPTAVLPDEKYNLEILDEHRVAVEAEQITVDRVTGKMIISKFPRGWPRSESEYLLALVPESVAPPRPARPLVKKLFS
jgi:hypothetical protein